jgi:hypothetical protein
VVPDNVEDFLPIEIEGTENEVEEVKTTNADS